MAVVKANGYGHGLLNVAQCIEDADGFGVARLEEAIALRDGGVTAKLILLEGFFRPVDLTTLVMKDIETVVHNEKQLEMLEQVSLSKPATVWLKLDTGMHR